MIASFKNYINRRLFHTAVTEKDSAEAYDLWSTDYDVQPGNLMLDLDEILFARLLENVNLQNKAVADVGCGTGRHWNKILAKNPDSLTGFDVSAGMLNKLKKKFPKAHVYKTDDSLPIHVPQAPFDVLVSTLTIAHIENIGKALSSWCNLLKANAGIIITDFHPKLLAFGGKRTFKHGSKQMAVRNYVYHIDTIKNLLLENGFTVAAEDEFRIDETVKHYYDAQNALPVYEQFKGFPVIYGIHLKRGHDPE